MLLAALNPNDDSPAPQQARKHWEAVRLGVVVHKHEDIALVRVEYFFKLAVGIVGADHVSG